MQQALFLKEQNIRKPFSLRESLHGIFPKKNTTKIRTKTADIVLMKSNSSDFKANELNKSIIYAKRIQEGMMLKEKHLTRLFPESFLFFQPKDIVSGDFYWFTRIGNKIVVAVADCTGHGIPGAFMSVLGISLLNQIVIEEGQTDSALILQRLNHKLKKAFAYSSDIIGENTYHDGMDIALCTIDTEKNQLEFSGALRSLYLLRQTEIIELKGSKYPIGGMDFSEVRDYSSRKVIYIPGDRLYLFSDGYADQFGGKNNRKFMVKGFKETLIRTNKLSMSTQCNELRRRFNEWKNNEEQTDDVLVMGLKL